MSIAHILTWFVPEHYMMTQNRLIPSNRDAGRANGRSRCCLQHSYVGFRFVRHQYSPWFVLAIALLKLPFVAGVERTQVQTRYFNALVRIDFVAVYGLLNDLLW